jgi:putrescine transport system permease protein
MTTTSPAAPPRVKQRTDLVRIVMGVWTGLVLVFMFIPIGLVILHSFNRGGSFSIWSNAVSTKWWGELFDPRATWALVARFAIIVALFVALPRVIRRVRGDVNRHVARWSGVVGFVVAVVVNWAITDGFRDIFRNAGLGDALRNSFVAAFGATIVAVVLGGLAGVALARRGGFWSAPFMAVLFLILVTPEIMDAIALLGWFVRIGNWPLLGFFDEGMVRLWVGQSLYASAVVTLIVRARLAGLDESLEEAAADLGAPPGRAFRQITLPLISSALVAGGLLSFTLCLDNTIISSLVSTAGSSTYPVFVLGAIKSTIKPSVGVAAVVLFAMTVAALAFVAVVLRRSGDSSSQIAATMTGS